MTKKNDYLAHFGVPGMKWGQRKARSSIGSDERKLMKQYRNEYKVKKLSGQNPTIGKGMNRQIVGKTGYAIQKTHEALSKKYGEKAVREHNAKVGKNTLKVGSAMAAVSIAGMGAMAASSVMKSKKTSIGKIAVDALIKANYKAGKVAGRTYATAQVLRRNKRYMIP